MKYFYLLICITFSCFVNAQIINFPDANFKAKLLGPESAFNFSLGWVSADTNSDGEIDMSEAAAIFALNVSNGNISDLTGISNFINMKTLWCQNNLLTTLTINPSIEMWDVNASHNQLSSINVHFVTGEQEYDPSINLSYNNLTTFSLSNVVVWFGLSLSHNHLTSLNINSCVLYDFEADNNNLSSINFTGNNYIGGTSNFQNNPFDGLNFHNVNFGGAFVFGNNTRDALYFNQSQPANLFYSSVNTSCDFGNYRVVANCEPTGRTGEINIYTCPNLQDVTLKNGFEHTTVTCDDGDVTVENPALWLAINNAPNLSHICVDSPAEKTCVQFWVDLAGLQNQITVDSNCPISSMDVEEVIAERFTVFPIPVTNLLQIQSNENLKIKSIQIYNNLGQLIRNEIGHRQDIDVSGLAKGIYCLKIKSNESNFTKRFIKE